MHEKSRYNASILLNLCHDWRTRSITYMPIEMIRNNEAVPGYTSTGKCTEFADYAACDVLMLVFVHMQVFFCIEHVDTTSWSKVPVNVLAKQHYAHGCHLVQCTKSPLSLANQ